MTAYQKLKAAMDAGELILIDGATGTEVERRGVPHLENAWNGGAAMTHPEIVIDVHQDYIHHGAQVIIANTFANTRQAMTDSGHEHEFLAYNRRGIELALEARDRMARPDVVVAGGISHWSWTDNHPDQHQLYKSVCQQAKTMEDAGADLIILEMMIDIERLRTVLSASLTAHLPVWVGLTIGFNDNDEVILRNGDSISEALKEIDSDKVDLINLMHSDVSYIDQGLSELQKGWRGHIGVYAHTGTFKDHKWVFENCITAESYGAYAQQWINQGAALIGGCCGIGPAHIEWMQQNLRPKSGTSF